MKQDSRSVSLLLSKGSGASRGRRDDTWGAASSWKASRGLRWNAHGRLGRLGARQRSQTKQPFPWFRSSHAVGVGNRVCAIRPVRHNTLSSRKSKCSATTVAACRANERAAETSRRSQPTGRSTLDRSAPNLSLVNHLALCQPDPLSRDHFGLTFNFFNVFSSPPLGVKCPGSVFSSRDANQENQETAQL